MENRDFSKSVIYCITPKDDKETILYVGSSTDYKKREIKHKKNIYDKTHYNCILYKYIKERGGFKNFEFNVLEEFEAQNKYDLLKRERFYFNKHQPILNSVIPYNSKKCRQIEQQLILTKIIDLMQELAESINLQ